MASSNWQTVALRWLSLCGIVAPPVDAAVNALVAAAQPHYDFVRDYVSSLAAADRPGSAVLCALWAAFPLVFGPFAVAVYAGLRGHRFGRIPPALLLCFSLFLGLCGIFRFDPTDPDLTLSSRTHMIVSTLASAVLFPTPFCLWLATRRDPRWQGVRRFSLLLQAVGLMAGFLLALAYFEVLSLGGLAERGYWAVYYVWIVGVALKLRCLGNTAGPASLRSAARERLAHSSLRVLRPRRPRQ